MFHSECKKTPMGTLHGLQYEKMHGNLRIDLLWAQLSRTWELNPTNLLVPSCCHINNLSKNSNPYTNAIKTHIVGLFHNPAHQKKSANLITKFLNIIALEMPYKFPLGPFKPSKKKPSCPTWRDCRTPPSPDLGFFVAAGNPRKHSLETDRGTAGRRVREVWQPRNENQPTNHGCECSDVYVYINIYIYIESFFNVFYRYRSQ